MSDDPHKAFKELYEDLSKAVVEQMVVGTSWEHGYWVSNPEDAAQWAPIPDPAAQPVVVHAYGGGGGGSGGDGQMRITAVGTNGQGGAGGQTYTCRCGLQATRFTGALGECAKCHQHRRITDQMAATVGQSQSAFADAVERITNAGRVAKPVPPPEPTHCGCGASFATVKRVTLQGISGREDTCGDCFMRRSDKATIDARIRDAREGRDEDPTTWTAGATPGWEWP